MPSKALLGRRANGPIARALGPDEKNKLTRLQDSRFGTSPPDLPAGACDCHVHIFGPVERFSFAANRRFTPGPASVEELLELQMSLDLERAVLVQPSPYGIDNACLLAALTQLGERARGVAAIDAEASDDELRALHAAGVRAARLNLETSRETDAISAEARLRALAARVAGLGWHVQLYAGAALIADLEGAILELPVPVVIDHFGQLAAAQGPSQPALEPLLRLLQSGRVYLKLSAPYRISSLADYSDVAPLARLLIAHAPQRMLWGTDWPHTGPIPGIPRRPDILEPFRPVDDGAALRRLIEWAPDRAVLRAILVDNPARLFDFN